MFYPNIKKVGGYLDKEKESTGLYYKENPEEKKIVVQDNLIFVDSRDCVGERSLADSRIFFLGTGGRETVSGLISNTTGKGVSPITITTQGILIIDELINGDTVIIYGVHGNTNANGTWRISSVIPGNPGTFSLDGSLGNGDYSGGGLYTREATSGYPQIEQNTTSTIEGNKIIVKLSKKLKVVKSLSMIHSIIPRDIIPLTTYLPDFVSFSSFIRGDINPNTVRVATTIAGTLATDFEAGDTIDGITLLEDDRILLKNQASAIENGIYIVQSAGAPIRSDDMPTGTPTSVVLGYWVLVVEGIVNSNLTYMCTTATGAVGVGLLTFTNIPLLPPTFVSYIIQEALDIERRAVGFYSTPLELFRTYNGAFTLPNAYTPPPLRLWQPDVSGASQFPPYPYQTVPTYKTTDFSITGEIGDFYLILSGHGVYDLNDWTFRTNASTAVNVIITILARTLLLLAITPDQTINDNSVITLIISSNITSNTSSLDYYGYGDYQRFIPGPGLGLAYQPATTDGANPTIPGPDWPVSFPFFKGNVWGPYNSPGDRFQKLGLRDTLQDLYLNGDMSNLTGSPIIKPWLPIETFMNDVTFGIDFTSLVNVTFSNIVNASNPNILNAMRVFPNGYGAGAVLNLGEDENITTRFLDAGGQGPDPFGTPVNGYNDGTTPTGFAWVTTAVTPAGGTGVYTDEIGTGPDYTSILGTTMFVEEADAENVGNEGPGDATVINRRISWYDQGENNGQFVSEMSKYRDWVITELPDTNIVMNIFQVQRNSRVQSTNQFNPNNIFSLPIRLNLGTTTGTQEYVENIQALMARSQLYWKKEFLTPLQSLYELELTFTTFEGNVIPLEKMLQPRRSVVFLEILFGALGANVFDFVSGDVVTDNPLSFLFNPLDPRLIGREKRNISFIFSAETYQYESPGLFMSIVKDMLDSERSDHDQTQNISNIIRASNYESYMSAAFN